MCNQVRQLPGRLGEGRVNGHTFRILSEQVSKPHLGDGKQGTPTNSSEVKKMLSKATPTVTQSCSRRIRLHFIKSERSPSQNGQYFVYHWEIKSTYVGNWIDRGVLPETEAPKSHREVSLPHRKRWQWEPGTAWRKGTFPRTWTTSPYVGRLTSWISTASLV